MRLNGLSTLLALCHAVGAVSTVAVTVGAAQVPEIPRFDIQSKQDLTVALGMYGPDGAFPQAPMIAAEGRRVVPWLLEIAGGEREPLRRRQVALVALGYTRDPSAVPLLLRLAAGTTDPSLEAGNALVGYSLPEVCEFWASRLSVTYPGSERTSAYNAARGIGYCDPRYEPRVREIARASRDWLVQGAAERSLAQLALPESERVKGPLLVRGQGRIFAGPPRPDGVYVPSDSMAVRIRWFVCQHGCPDGLLPPDFNLRGRRR